MGSSLLYIILVLICLVLPWIKNYGLLQFFVLLLLLPVGNAFSEFFYLGGLFFFDFYFMMLFLCLLYKRQIRGKWILWGGGVILCYAAWSGVTRNYIDVYYLRDFRLLLFAMTLLCFASLQSKNRLLTGRSVKLIAIGSGISCVIYSALSGLGFFVFDDDFYTRNSFRYFSVASYFCFGFVAFSSALPTAEQSGRLYYSALAICMVGIFLTGFRTMAFVAIVIFVASSFRSRRMVLITVTLLAVLGPLLAIQEGGVLAQRILLVSPLQIVQDIQIRYSPFFAVFSGFSDVELFVGGGFGQTFEIPWFSYRESKDSENNFIDSTYLSLYAKFGVCAFFLMFGYLKSYAAILNDSDPLQTILLTICVTILWLVYAIPYQMAAVGLTMALFCIGSVHNSRASNSIGKLR